MRLPLFRKDIKFKVVKSEEKPKEEAKPFSESKTKPETEPLDLAELQNRRGQGRSHR
jgi:hypothetical protein